MSKTMKAAITDVLFVLSEQLYCRYANFRKVPPTNANAPLQLGPASVQKKLSSRTDFLAMFILLPCENARNGKVEHLTDDVPSEG